MVRDATARVVELDDDVADDEPVAVVATPLYNMRAEAVLAALKDVNTHRVVDLGCGEGARLKRLVDDPTSTEIIGTDVSNRSLLATEEKLHFRDLSDTQRARIRLLQSSITYQDDRINDLDAAILKKVIEHVDPDRLGSVEAAAFAHARPNAVIVTTPNSEYNVLYPSLAAGSIYGPDYNR